MISEKEENDRIPPLSMFWPLMSEAERLTHFQQIGSRLLEHRYRYYVLDEPVVQDSEYDHLERYYKRLATELNLPDTTADMVDYDLSRLDAQEAKARVDSKTDNHSLWIAAMTPVWDKLGPPAKDRE
jgi:hypothetical protein